VAKKGHFKLFHKGHSRKRKGGGALTPAEFGN
jgi:hypothetical protein